MKVLRIDAHIFKGVFMRLVREEPSYLVEIQGHDREDLGFFYLDFFSPRSLSSVVRYMEQSHGKVVWRLREVSGEGCHK